MQSLVAIAYVLLATVVLMRVLPKLWRDRRRVIAGIVLLLVLVVGIGYLFSAPLTVPLVLRDRVLPVALISIIFAWYTRLEISWDKELREEVSKNQ